MLFLPVARSNKEAKFLMLGGHRVRTENWDKARWAWVLALVGGISYFYVVCTGIDGLLVSVWKTTGVAFLALWACLNARVKEHQWIAAVLAFGAAGDFLLAEFGLVVGGTAFAIGHAIAIRAYWRHRRGRWSPSQQLLVYSITPLALVIAWQLARQSDPSLLAAAMVYTFIVAVMSAAAWGSRFPRYRTGLGAMLFLISDLVIFAGAGGTIDRQVASLFVWPLYFAGQALIAWGVVSTLSREACSAAD